LDLAPANCNSSRVTRGVSWGSPDGGRPWTGGGEHLGEHERQANGTDTAVPVASATTTESATGDDGGCPSTTAAEQGHKDGMGCAAGGGARRSQRRCSPVGGRAAAERDGPRRGVRRWRCDWGWRGSRRVWQAGGGPGGSSKRACCYHFLSSVVQYPPEEPVPGCDRHRWFVPFTDATLVAKKSQWRTRGD